MWWGGGWEAYHDDFLWERLKEGKKEKKGENVSSKWEEAGDKTRRTSRIPNEPRNTTRYPQQTNTTVSFSHNSHPLRTKK
jgi:hypothetical protein